VDCAGFPSARLPHDNVRVLFDGLAQFTDHSPFQVNGFAAKLDLGKVSQPFDR
jgi:hypothetical protein